MLEGIIGFGLAIFVLNLIRKNFVSALTEGSIGNRIAGFLLAVGATVWALAVIFAVANAFWTGNFPEPTCRETRFESTCDY